MEERKCVLSHITPQDKRKVYPPSVDTFLLMDSIISDLPFIKEKNPTFILQVGVGCGAVLSALYGNLGPSAIYIGLDINKQAVFLSQTTFKQNENDLTELVVADLYKGLNLKNMVDVLICNPPYVITSTQEFVECQERKDISSSFSGGENGREFIDALIREKDILTDDGIVYMLYQEHNGVFGGVKLSEEREFCEGLSVVRLNKSEFL